MNRELFGWIVFGILISGAWNGDAQEKRESFLKGASGKSHLPSIEMLRDLGVEAFRPELNWKLVEPDVPEGSLTVNEVRQQPELIDRYLAEKDWTRLDRLVDPLIENGIQVVAVVGLGYNSGLPRYQKGLATPNALGRETYLGRIYLYARATVRRYRDRVMLWQIENELNEAGLTSFYGWRSPAPSVMGLAGARESYWNDFGFLTELLATLAEAVRIEAPGKPTVLNFHTDIHDVVHQRVGWLAGKKTWSDAIRAWSKYLDWIGIDAYPNYYAADPILFADIEARIQKVKALGLGKPIVVLETAYPVPMGEIPPEPVDWNEVKQARYIEVALEGAHRAGARGFFYFGLGRSGARPPAGGYSSKDLDALTRMGRAFRGGDVGGLLTGIVRYGPTYLRKRFPEVLMGAEGYGLLRQDGSQRPGYRVLKDWYARPLEWKR